jgi:hypothetical protein
MGGISIFVVIIATDYVSWIAAFSAAFIAGLYDARWMVILGTSAGLAISFYVMRESKAYLHNLGLTEFAALSFFYYVCAAGGNELFRASRARDKR